MPQWAELAVIRGFVYIGVSVSVVETRPLYGVEGWPRIRGLEYTTGILMQPGPRQGGRRSGVVVKRGSTVVEFQGSWNNHGLSSDGNKTPYQLFVEGLQSTHNYAVGSLDSGANLDVSSLTNDRVSVPRISFIPCIQLQHILMSSLFC